MPDEKNKLLLFILILLILSISVNAVKNPIIQRREDFMKSMYSQLCKEKPFSRYCLITYTGDIMGDSFFYDSYLIEYDFTIPSPALSKQPGFCIDNGCSGTTCEDDKWKIHYGSCCRTGTSSIGISNNNLVIDGRGSQPANALYKINLKNKDIKIKVSHSGGCGAVGSGGSASFSINLGGQTMISRDTNAFGGTKVYLYEFVKDVTDKNNFVVLENGEAISEIVIQGNEAFLGFSASGGNSCGCGDSSGLTIDWIKSKPYFSCEMENDEVVVRKRFGEGSTFNKDDLDCKNFGCEPIKYCPQDYPAVVRSYLDRGVKSDTRGTIIVGLANGDSFTVPSFQAYEIQWITKYVVGMQETCDPLSEYYDTETDSCKPQGFLFEPACLVNSDCWIPSSCVGVNVQCIDNKCVYSGDCFLPPQAEENIWGLINSIWNNFWSWIKGLF